MALLRTTLASIAGCSIALGAAQLSAANAPKEATAQYAAMPETGMPEAGMPEAAALDLALIHAESGRYAEAIRLYRSVLAHNPSPEVKTNVEQTLQNLEALQKLSAPVTPAPQPVIIPPAPVTMAASVMAPLPISVEAQLDTALDYAEAGNYGAASTIYQDVLATNPNPAIRQNVVNALLTLQKLQAQQPKSAHISELDALRAATETSPGNMDALFAYAQKAQAMDKPKEAEQAYLRMLELNPSLDRVRMDLALHYSQEGDYAKAKPLLEHVLEGNPPAPVQARAQTMLEEAQNPLKRYGLEASLTTGYNYDSNANAASSTDAISLFDSTIDLPDGSQQQDDGQLFLMGNLSHNYQFPTDPEHSTITTRWYSTGTAYKSEQISLDELDIILFSGRTGPIIDFTEYNTTLGLVLGYNDVRLGGNHFLSVFSGEANLKYQLNSEVALTSSMIVEDRAFKNSPTVTTHEDRDGKAHQISLGAVYNPTPQDSLNGQLTLRQERAVADYYANTQAGVSTGYTHAFSNDLFANLSSGYKESDYDAPDIFISNRIREDKEATAGLTVGKVFDVKGQSVLGTVGYQYRTVDSNIQNYNYDNHRLSTSVGVKF